MIHAKLLRTTGWLSGIRNVGLLQSANCGAVQVFEE